MKNIFRKIIKIIFGTEDNLLLKLNGSLLASGLLFLFLAIVFEGQENTQVYETFSYISAILIAIWLLIITNNDTVLEFAIEAVRLFAFFTGFIFSLNFCLNDSINSQGFDFLIKSTLYCIVIVACFFYLIAKFLDILTYTKKLLIQLKGKLFDSVSPTASKAKGFIENTTAFLVAIASLGVAVKTIIEPILNMLN